MDNIQSKNENVKDIILVTGGSSGIGLGIVRYFLENKNTFVYIFDVNEKDGHKLEAEYKNHLKFVCVDVTDDKAVENAFNLIFNDHGRLDCVVNCAGILDGQWIVKNEIVFSSKKYNRVMDINVYGTFNICRYAAKLMIKNSKDEKECNGCIILISSIASVEGQIGQTAYSASKSAINAMTLPMARDLGKYKIRVNTVAPGLIDTPMGLLISDKTKLILKENTPLKTFGLPAQIADAIFFIYKNNFMNGEVIRVDGGIRSPQY